MAGSKTTSWMTIHLTVDRVTLHRYRPGVRGLIGPDVELGPEIAAAPVEDPGQSATFPMFTAPFTGDEQTMTVQPVLWIEHGMRYAMEPFTAFRGCTLDVPTDLTMTS